ncbi:MAG TPA: hypothetical protein VFY26_13010 [Anaerolineales bacterium]|nr:hypothetical protein [Anaerolineales bacterium]
MELPVVYSLQKHYNFLSSYNKERSYELVGNVDSYITWHVEAAT